MVTKNIIKVIFLDIILYYYFFIMFVGIYIIGFLRPNEREKYLIYATKNAKDIRGSNC